MNDFHPFSVLHNFCLDHNEPEPRIRPGWREDAGEDFGEGEFEINEQPRALRLHAMRERQFIIDYVPEHIESLKVETSHLNFRGVHFQLTADDAKRGMAGTLNCPVSKYPNYFVQAKTKTFLFVLRNILFY